jgi:hypothetical protein
MARGPAALAVLLVAHQPARAVAGDDARAQRVVAGGAVEEVGERRARRPAPCRARSTSSGGRSASLARTPGMRSSRMPPAPALAGAAGDVRDPHVSARHAAQAEAQAVPARRARRTRAVDRDAVHAPAPSQ